MVPVVVMLPPITTPVEAPMVATDVVPDDHVPPVVALVSVMELPPHTDEGPEIGGKTASALNAAKSEMKIDRRNFMRYVWFGVVIKADNNLKRLGIGSF